MDPIAFEPKMNKLASYLYTGTWFNHVASAVGKGRYAAEHWVCSSPTVRVIDVMPANAGRNKQFFQAGYDLLPEKSGVFDIKPSSIPRNDVDVGEYIKSGHFMIMMKYGVYADSRLKEYSALYGDIPLNQGGDKYCRSTPCKLYTRIAKMMEIAVENNEFDPVTAERCKRWVLGFKTAYPALICPKSCEL